MWHLCLSRRIARADYGRYELGSTPAPITDSGSQFGSVPPEVAIVHTDEYKHTHSNTHTLTHSHTYTRWSFVGDLRCANDPGVGTFVRSHREHIKVFNAHSKYNKQPQHDQHKIAPTTRHLICSVREYMCMYLVMFIYAHLYARRSAYRSRYIIDRYTCWCAHLNIARRQPAASTT